MSTKSESKKAESKGKAEKSESKKAESKGKAEKSESKKAENPIVSVETVKASKAPKKASDLKVVKERVSGTHRVKFMPNGNNGTLGDKMLRPAATTAQDMVDKGWGDIIAE